MTCTREAVGVDEAADLRVIVPAFYIVKVGVCVIVVATVAQGVERAEVVGRQVVDAQNLAIGVVGVGRAGLLPILYYTLVTLSRLL